jgi:hypothetical protein
MCEAQRSVASSSCRRTKSLARSVPNLALALGNEGTPGSMQRYRRSHFEITDCNLKHQGRGAVAGHTAGVTCVMMASPCITYYSRSR